MNLALLASGLALGASLLAQPAGGDAGRTFRADFNNPAVSPAQWTLTLNPDGTGHFHSVRGNAPAPDPPAFEAPSVDRDIQVSGQFAQRVFQQVHDHAVSSGDCESHMKVAFQGWKKIAYSGPEGQWSCEFNYSRDKQV